MAHFTESKSKLKNAAPHGQIKNRDSVTKDHEEDYGNVGDYE